jgi:hypothetical protein
LSPMTRMLSGCISQHRRYPQSVYCPLDNTISCLKDEVNTPSRFSVSVNGKHKQGLTSCPCPSIDLWNPWLTMHTTPSFHISKIVQLLLFLTFSSQLPQGQLSNLKPMSLHVVNITESQRWYGIVLLPATHIGTDEVKTMVSADINKGGILGQKTITRMQHCASMAQCCCHNVGDV